MPKKQRSYDKEFKVQALKLADEIGCTRAATELDIPVGTLYGWRKAIKKGTLDKGIGTYADDPETALTLSEELVALRKRVRDQEREIRRLKEENEFLEEASAFFAASRRKSAKIKG